MSDTTRVGGTRDGKAYDATNRRPYHSTESKPARKARAKAQRIADHQAIVTGTYDPPTMPRTSGWLTH